MEPLTFKLSSWLQTSSLFLVFWLCIVQFSTWTLILLARSSVMISYRFNACRMVLMEQGMHRLECFSNSAGLASATWSVFLEHTVNKVLAKMCAWRLVHVFRGDVHIHVDTVCVAVFICTGMQWLLSTDIWEFFAKKYSHAVIVDIYITSNLIRQYFLMFYHVNICEAFATCTVLRLIIIRLYHAQWNIFFHILAVWLSILKYSLTLLCSFHQWVIFVMGLAKL